MEKYVLFKIKTQPGRDVSRSKFVDISIGLHQEFGAYRLVSVDTKHNIREQVCASKHSYLRTRLFQGNRIGNDQFFKFGFFDPLVGVP